MEKKYYDAIVVGAGHAGVEAALSLARTNNKTLLLTLSLDAIAFLACNPSIGGTAKGQLVSEIDALGGEMGVNADKATIQLRMLNRGKGIAVQSLRAQADKNLYHIFMKQTLENTENLDIKQAEAKEILTKDNKVVGLITTQGEEFECKSIIVCSGVYLNSRIFVGDYNEAIGPNNFKPSNNFTKSLIDLGLEIRRFKTGTPMRVHSDSIDYSVLEIQKGEDNIQLFSFLNEGKKPNNIKDCYLAYTNETTHELIRNNLEKFPMYSGEIVGVGPRYCPSIETKIMRFSDKERHQLFIEPESLNTKEVYIQGFSTSAPVYLQEQMLHSLKGFENAKIMRDAYAIEYDCINSLQLLPTLEYKNVSGLYFAGQVNGTSGYEEAASQGLIAGINANLKMKNKEPLILSRSDAYIGVLIDDLVTKGTNEPYRMMTSRAEYRLVLRQDNADLRLTEIGRNVGLVTDERYEIFTNKKQQIETLTKELNTLIKADKLNPFLEKLGENNVESSVSVYNLIKRNNVTLQNISEYFNLFKNYSPTIIEEVNTTVKYEGYIKKQKEQIESAKKQEDMILDKDFDYSKILGLRLEAIQKLNEIKPLNIGQASRISGISPADINVLIVYLKTKK
ncbi:MAG: tRNA uridine-5-carboxymethylaminomethyl(34) synthesis enzyme MnmG [Clostridiales bacterium]|nr:tRNA uridine-5-carboxymethylaminomethyl(34) synthesis enzyme MnmG [Clostridiales bacterium]